MTDECLITRGTAGTAYDPESDTYTATPGETVYEGRCEVRARDNADRQVEAGGETVSLWPYIVSVPMSATGIDLDDTVTITTASDPELVDLELRVRDAPKGSLMARRSLGCELSS